MLVDKKEWKKKEEIDLDKIGFSDCGERSWEYIDGEDYGDGGNERWRDPKTGKIYEVLWDRVRHTNKESEVK